MSTRREFSQYLPATGAAFAVNGPMALDGIAPHGQQSAPLPGHFHPQGEAPSKYTQEVLRQTIAE